MIIPFGRLMLWFLITSGLFNVFGRIGSIQSIEILSVFYAGVTGISMALASICLVLWVLFTVIRPSSLFEPGRSIRGIGWLDDLFCEIPHFRIGLLALIISVALAWIHPFVQPLALTAFLFATVMWLGRLLLFVYGSAY